MHTHPRPVPAALPHRSRIVARPGTCSCTAQGTRAAAGPLWCARFSPRVCLSAVCMDYCINCILRNALTRSDGSTRQFCSKSRPGARSMRFQGTLAFHFQHAAAATGPAGARPEASGELACGGTAPDRDATSRCEMRGDARHTVSVVPRGVRARRATRLSMSCLDDIATHDKRFVRFVYGPGYVTAHVVPVALCDSPGARCG